MRHCVGVIDGAAAGSDDGILAADAEEDLVLNLVKPLEPVVIDDLLEALAGLFLDQQVPIDKAVAQRLGEHDTDRALAAARHPNQYDVHTLFLSDFSKTPWGSIPKNQIRSFARLAAAISAGSKSSSTTVSTGTLPMLVIIRGQKMALKPLP